MRSNLRSSIVQGKLTKEQTKLRDHIQSLLDLWLPRLNLEKHKVQLEFITSDAEWAERGGDRGSSMSVTAEWDYKLATIKVNMPLCAQAKQEEIEDYVVHELVHVLLSPIDILVSYKKPNRLQRAIDEIATVELTDVLLKAYRTNGHS